MIKSGGPGMPGFAATASRSRTWTSRCWMQNARKSSRLEDDVSCTCSTKLPNQIKQKGEEDLFFTQHKSDQKHAKGIFSRACTFSFAQRLVVGFKLNFNSLIVSTTNSPRDRLRLRFFFHEFHVQTRTRNSAQCTYLSKKKNLCTQISQLLFITLEEKKCTFI